MKLRALAAGAGVAVVLVVGCGATGTSKPSVEIAQPLPSATTGAPARGTGWPSFTGHESKPAVLAMRATCMSRLAHAAMSTPAEAQREIADCRERQRACTEGSEMLRRALEHDADWEVRMEAARVAGDVTEEQFCFEGRRDACTWSSSNIESICDELAWVVPALVRAIHDPSWQVGAAAIQGLAHAEPVLATTVDALRAVVEKPPPDDAEGSRMLTFACAALERLGSVSAPATAALASRVGPDERNVVRISAIRALSAMGRDAAAALPKLVALVTDPDASVRMNVATALGSIAPLTPDVRRALEALEKDADPLVAGAAHGALLGRR